MENCTGVFIFDKLPQRLGQMCVGAGYWPVLTAATAAQARGILCQAAEADECAAKSRIAVVGMWLPEEADVWRDYAASSRDLLDAIHGEALARKIRATILYSNMPIPAEWFPLFTVRVRKTASQRQPGGPDAVLAALSKL